MTSPAGTASERIAADAGREALLAVNFEHHPAALGLPMAASGSWTAFPFFAVSSALPFEQPPAGRTWSEVEAEPEGAPAAAAVGEHDTHGQVAVSDWLPREDVPLPRHDAEGSPPAEPFWRLPDASPPIQSAPPARSPLDHAAAPQGQVATRPYGFLPPEFDAPPSPPGYGDARGYDDEYEWEAGPVAPTAPYGAFATSPAALEAQPPFAVPARTQRDAMPSVRGYVSALRPDTTLDAPLDEALPMPLAGGLFDVEPGAAPHYAAEPRAQRWRILAAVVALCAVVGLTMLAASLVPGWLRTARAIPGVFNAPMMVVRAAVAGRVTVVGVSAGQLVEPQSLLLSFASNDAGHAERSVTAGVHGLIRSVETTAGSDIIRGAPLVRLQDCDRAFVTVPADAKLRAGSQVEVALPGVAPLFATTMRLSSGIMEPPDTVVAEVPAGTLAGTCPVGASVALTPISDGPASNPRPAV